MRDKLGQPVCLQPGIRLLKVNAKDCRDFKACISFVKSTLINLSYHDHILRDINH